MRCDGVVLSSSSATLQFVTYFVVASFLMSSARYDLRDSNRFGPRGGSAGFSGAASGLPAFCSDASFRKCTLSASTSCTKELKFANLLTYRWGSGRFVLEAAVCFGAFAASAREGNLSFKVACGFSSSTKEYRNHSQRRRKALEGRR